METSLLSPASLERVDIEYMHCLDIEYAANVYAFIFFQLKLVNQYYIATQPFWIFQYSNIRIITNINRLLCMLASTSLLL